MCGRVSEHVYSVRIGAAGLERLTLRVVVEPLGWEPPPGSKPLELEGDAFVGEVPMDPGDMALIRVEGLAPGEWLAIGELRRERHLVQDGDDFGSDRKNFLLVPGWQSSSEGMPYSYSIVPQPRVRTEEAA